MIMIYDIIPILGIEKCYDPMSHVNLYLYYSISMFIFIHILKYTDV